MIWIKKIATTPLDTIAKVIDSLEQQTNNRTNAPSIRAVNEALADKWADIYPIGSIYLTVDPTFDPSTTFGGTWEQIKDRFLLASGNTYTSGDEGGEATHTLTTQEIPAHKHIYGLITHHEQDQGGLKYSPPGDEDTMNFGDAETEPTGGTQPHNNMPPYLVVNVWQRTA